MSFDPAEIGKIKRPSDWRLTKEGMTLDEDGLDTTAPAYGYEHTEEGRKACGRGKREGEEHWNYGRKASAATRKKMRETHKGVPRKPHTEEGKRNISKAKMGKTPDQSYLTDEHRKARSERAKAQHARGDLAHTDESKRKIGETMKKVWAKRKKND